jgi:predicted rRNA methylase YqxC with S4 and FtsJ domains
MLWLRRDIAVQHPLAVDKMLVATGLAKSLTEARKLIEQGAIYVNNEKLVPPEEGFLPVVIVTEGADMGEYVSLGISPELAEKILNG